MQVDVATENANDAKFPIPYETSESLSFQPFNNHRSYDIISTITKVAKHIQQLWLQDNTKYKLEKLKKYL